MADELAFARKASGLVRGVSLFDAFGFGLMNQTPSFGFWTTISLGMVIFPGGNIMLAALITTIMCCIGYPLVWGILSASMPRSGGEYIYNSRILHPFIAIIGNAGNFAARFIGLAIATVFTFSLGLVFLANVMGWTSIGEWLATKWHLLLAASLLNLFGFFTVLFGVKVYSIVQRVFMGLGMLGTIVFVVVISAYSRDDFIKSWNALASEYDSLDYNQFIAAASAAAGGSFPTTWNWFDTLGMMGVLAGVMMYAFFISFLAGEVKRPDKTLLVANLLTVLVPGVLLIWFGAAINLLVSRPFLAAAGWVDYNGALEGYTFPFSPNFLGLLAVVNSNRLLLFIVGAGFFAFWAWIAALEYLVISRIMFAWGMDRMGPKWFTNVNARFASPVSNYLFFLLAGELVLILFVYVFYDTFAALSWTAIDLVFVLFITGISASVFPYVKKVRSIWDSSPFRTWRVLGIPAITAGAVVYLAYITILIVWLLILPNNRSVGLNSLYAFIVVWVFAIAWYFFWTRRSQRAGVDTAVTYGELPPD